MSQVIWKGVLWSYEQHHAKTSLGMCRQQRSRSACTFMQADQGLHCPLTESLDTAECMESKGVNDTLRMIWISTSWKALFRLTRPICKQRRPRPAWKTAETDQNFSMFSRYASSMCTPYNTLFDGVPGRLRCIEFLFNDTSTIVGHFVSSPRGRKGTDELAEERKENQRGWRKRWMTVQQQTNLPPSPTCYKNSSPLLQPSIFITKTRLYNFDPLKTHFYIVKLGFTGVYIIFLISAQNIDCG